MGKNLANTHGKLMHCILGNIIKSDPYHHKQQQSQKDIISKFSKEAKQIKLAREIFMSVKVYF